MKILFLSSQVPFRETRAGGAKRLYFLAKGLERHGEVHMACLDGCSEWRGDARPTLEFARSLFLPFDFMRPIRRSPLRVPIDYRPHFKHLRESLLRFVGETRYDLTLVAFPAALSLLLELPADRLGKVAYLEDDLIQEAYRKNAQSGFAPFRLARKFRYRQVLGFLRMAARRIHCLIHISAEEQRISRATLPSLPSLLIQYGVPLAELPCLPPPGTRDTLGFIGNFLHRPNLEALRWTLERLLPAMRKEHPGVRFLVAGTGMPSDALSSLRAQPGCEYLENVPDLRDFYGRIGIFVNPVFTGRGLRTKVVEAAAYGRPVVSTRLGAEGLGCLRVDLAEEPGEFREAAEKLWRDPVLYESTVRANRSAVEENFSIEAQVDRLIQWVSGTRGGAPRGESRT